MLTNGYTSPQHPLPPDNPPTPTFFYPQDNFSPDISLPPQQFPSTFHPPPPTIPPIEIFPQTRQFPGQFPPQFPPKFPQWKKNIAIQFHLNH